MDAKTHAKSSFFSRINANLGREDTGLADGLASGTTDVDIDFEITESGRTTIGRNVGGPEDETFDDMEFSITNTTGRVNTDRSMNTVGTIGTIETENTIEPAGHEFMDIATSTRSAQSTAQQGNDRRPVARDRLLDDHRSCRARQNVRRTHDRGRYHRQAEGHGFQQDQPLGFGA